MCVQCGGVERSFADNLPWQLPPVWFPNGFEDSTAPQTPSAGRGRSVVRPGRGPGVRRTSTCPSVLSWKVDFKPP
eukprot:1451952-Prymnesium_polylepis.1